MDAGCSNGCSSRLGTGKAVGTTETLYRYSTGMPSLDAVIQGVYDGDNIVW